MATGDSSSVRRSGNTFSYFVDAANSSSLNSHDVFLPPPGYRLVSVKSSFATASSSMTYALRKITDTSAPNAAASATVIELLAGPTASLAGTANTVLTPALTTTAGAKTFKPGDRLAITFAGSSTGLIGACIQFEFVPANQYGVS